MHKLKTKIQKFILRCAGVNLIMLLISILAFAETIHLKSGKVVEGQIVEKTGDYIRIDIEGIKITFFDDEIEKIESVQPTIGTVPDVQVAAQGELYVNEKYSFEIRGPKGWSKSVIVTPLGKDAIFFKKEPEDITSFPMILVEILDIPEENIQTVLDFANFSLLKYQEAAERKQNTIEVIESPQEVEINGIKAARFIIDRFDPRRKLLFRMVAYKFMQDRLGVSVQGIDYPDSFEKTLENFEEAVNSFKFK